MKKRKKPSKSKQDKASPSQLRKLVGWIPNGLLLILLLLPALAFSSGARETFRLPKLLVSEMLGLLTLIFLASRLWKVERVDWRRTLGHPAVLVMLPLLAVASLSYLTSAHRLHVSQGLLSLWIAGGCLIGWSLGCRRGELATVLRLLVVPAALLSLFGLLQHYGVIQLFQFRQDVQERIALTSLAGGAFDLAAYLVLPALIAQVACRGATHLGSKVAWGAAAALFVYVIAVTRTLSAIGGLLLATLVLWSFLLPRRRFGRLLAAASAVLIVAMLLVAPLRQRLVLKVEQAKQGHLNQLLNGRLDGWRTALWMLQEEPLLGVGHGAYRAEFGNAKLQLREDGVVFFRKQHQPYFVNAHNEFLEAAAEWGWTGLAALAFSLIVLLRHLLQRTRQGFGAVRAETPQDPAEESLALMWAGLVGLGVMACGNFPLRIALVAYPFLILLAWALQNDTPTVTATEVKS